MAHRLFIGKGMITLNLKRIFLTLTLLPLFAVAADDCALSDPTLTVQAYTVNPQTERVKMYWQKANGEAWGTLHALLADIFHWRTIKIMTEEPKQMPGGITRDIAQIVDGQFLIQIIIDPQEQVA